MNTNDPIVKNKINRRQAELLLEEEWSDSGPTAPTDGFSQEENENFLAEVTGMTYLEYAQQRWPDNVEEQLDIMMDVFSDNQE